LVEQHYAGLYRYAFAMLRSKQAAEDAVQDAFERALTVLGRYPEERIRAMLLRAWLYRITLNVARNRLRRNREVAVGGDPIRCWVFRGLGLARGGRTSWTCWRHWGVCRSGSG